MFTEMTAFLNASLMQFLGSPLLGIVSFAYMILGAGRFGLSRSPRALSTLYAGTTGLGVYSVVNGSWGTFAAAIVFVGGGLFGLSRLGIALGEAVPTVATVIDRTAERGLSALVGWLRATETTFSMPTHAVAVLTRIREHVELLAEAAGKDAGDERIEKMIGGDLRDLLVRYRKVEATRRLLPGSASLGDAELVNGMVKIEQALVVERKTIADRALHDLKVQERYIETKHEDGLN